MTSNKTFVIAEAGVNHNGLLKMAKELVDIAIASVGHSCEPGAINSPEDSSKLS